MKTIWKFQISLTESQIVDMPVGAKLLHVGVQGDAVQLWAEVDPSAPKQQRFVWVYATGQPMPSYRTAYVGTFMIAGGAYVFHVYDGGPLLAD